VAESVSRQFKSVKISAQRCVNLLVAIVFVYNLPEQIYATVGTDEKVQYLMKAFGLPRNRIYNSRDISFQPDLMHETNGRGVDIVLNSLAGKFLHASWECVATFGRMIELGKRDFLTHGMLSMSPFIANRAFFGVDLLHICQESPLILERSVF
jgi:NADPH:quinone reductase-like Zn-dependent oxidoreductase